MAEDEVDIEKYAVGMLDTLLESPDRFKIEIVEFDGGIQHAALVCGKKVVALITPAGLDTIDEILDGVLEALEDDDEVEDEIEEDASRGHVVEGRVVKRGGAKKAGWKP